MLTYSFSDIGSDSLYHHLYQCIKKDILSGVLPAGTKLPSKRTFAKNLGVSNITVENAYGQLQAEGYIYSIPKKGFYVQEISDLTPSTGTVSKQQTAYASPHRQFAADIVSNQMNPEQFPFSVWSKLSRETLHELHEELMETPPWGGIRELRDAICSQLKEFRNMEVAPEQVIVGAGTEYLYGLLIQLLGRDKIYAVENPGYHKIAKIYESYQVPCRYISMGNDGMDLQKLADSGAHVAHISPSHHFPTGIVMPIGARYELLGWATREKGRYIIEDDYDSEFRLAGKPIPTLQSIDMSERVIYMNTFTKSLSSTIRISYMVLPKHLLEQFAERLSFYSCTVSNFEQYTLARFIEDGYFEKHINRMRTHYRRIRDELLEAIKNSPLASRCEISEEDAGLHFLLRVDTNLSDAALLQKAKQAEIRLSCLSEYYHETTEDIPAHTLVINYSGLTSEEIPRVVALLTECVGE
ncbi:MAG: PLP-dependent aminotransferase family protein [Lachnospiraceae bacterium]|nr:PLP-dependent aminotransferase family protein [Lachnospiraceae bacterium]